MNKGTKGNNQTAKETKQKLTDQLAKIGISAEIFKRGKSGYDTMFSGKRTKADINRWNDIGNVFFTGKSYMAEKKINLNSGYLTDIRVTYFKELTPQDVSNAIWLHEHFPGVLEWIQKNKRNLSNPASVKQAIRKQLVESKADNAEFTNFGFEPPKPSEPKQPDGKKDNKRKTNTTIDDNLKHLELIASQLAKFKTNSWTMEHFKRFESVNQKLADFYVDLDEKLSKAKIVKVDDNTAKKVASK